MITKKVMDEFVQEVTYAQHVHENNDGDKAWFTWVNVLQHFVLSLIDTRGNEILMRKVSMKLCSTAFILVLWCDQRIADKKLLELTIKAAAEEDVEEIEDDEL